MKKKTIHYTDEAVDAKVINDFLPPPDKLVMKEETVEVTLTLSRKSVEFFKMEAEKHNSTYQTMIRSLLTQYSEHHH